MATYYENWYENPEITKEVQRTLKRANQRIVQVAKTFGKDSSTYNQYVGKTLSKRIVKDFVTVSEGGKKVGKGVTKGGYQKLDVRSINKMIRSGNADLSKVNQILAEFGGIRITPKGQIREVEGGGVPTLTSIEQRTRQKIENMGDSPDMYSKKEVRDITEELAEFSKNFQTVYDDYKAEFGIEAGADDPVIGQLYGKNRSGRLSYKKLQDIKNKMEADLKEAESNALAFENETRSKEGL